jgi:hypothetical protein
MIRTNKILLPLALAYAGVLSCETDKTASMPWRPFFDPAETLHATSLSDTIPVGFSAEEGLPGREMPASVFLSGLDSALIAQMIYPPDTADMQVYGRWVLPIDPDHDGYLVEIRQFWFAFDYLFLYAKRTNSFTGLLPLSQFYGGEGSQIKTASLFFDWENANGPKILTRKSEHALVIRDDEEVEDVYEESVSLWQWENGAFVEIPVADSSRWIEGYSIVW